MSAAYAELHMHSPFSFLDGGSDIETLVERAAALGLPALALTDHNNTAAAVKFTAACQAYGIQPVLGAEITLEDGSHLTLLARNRAGYGQICRLITRAYAEGGRLTPRLPWNQLADCDSVICLSGCRRGLVAARMRDNRPEAAEEVARRLRDSFGAERFFLELQDDLTPDSQRVCLALAALADRLGVGAVATNNVHYAAADDFVAHDLLRCVAAGVRYEEPHPDRPLNAERRLKSAREMAELFAWRPDVVGNAMRIASLCEPALPNPEDVTPRYPVPEGRGAAEEYLRYLVWKGARARYGIEPPVPVPCPPILGDWAPYPPILGEDRPPYPPILGDFARESVLRAESGVGGGPGAISDQPSATDQQPCEALAESNIENRKSKISYDRIPFDDEETFRMIRAGKAVGTFQFESAAQMALAVTLNPEHFEDLVAAVALIRPGPLQGHVVQRFVACRNGWTRADVLHPCLQPVLAKTYGCIVFQEQVNQVVSLMTGCSDAEGDKFRKSITQHTKRGTMERLRQEFVRRSCERHRDFDEARANRLFDQIQGWAGYGFTEGHAASFALTGYRTAYLSVHEPAAFYAGLMNHQPMGFFNANTLAGEARRRGVRILPVDINASADKCQPPHSLTQAPLSQAGEALMNGDLTTTPACDVLIPPASPEGPMSGGTTPSPLSHIVGEGPGRGPQLEVAGECGEPQRVDSGEVRATLGSR